MTFIQTLYKTENPKKPLSEYYELVLDSAPAEKGEGLFTFMVLHGWWDEAAKQPRENRNLLTPEEGLSEKEARGMFEQQRKYLASIGFVHCFMPDYYREKECQYTRLDR
ncbi:MAG TPA: hypothetical protein VJT08_07340 [Terriglobales bacterium]|nr:hypothetical protein [Acidobacteriaceae bacterium]HKR30273.1 hypothetical protein [Terriglobales bacterium]